MSGLHHVLKRTQTQDWDDENTLPPCLIYSTVLNHSRIAPHHLRIVIDTILLLPFFSTFQYRWSNQQASLQLRP